MFLFCVNPCSVFARICRSSVSGVSVNGFVILLTHSYTHVQNNIHAKEKKEPAAVNFTSAIYTVRARLKQPT